jgi:hypothetical protein
LRKTCRLTFPEDRFLIVKHFPNASQPIQCSVKYLLEDEYRPSIMVMSGINPGQEALLHLDSFNINPTYNTDGAIVNCLLQPGQIHNNPNVYHRILHPLIKPFVP